MTEMRRLRFSSSSSEVEGDDERELQEKSYDKPKRERNETLEATSSSKKKKKGPVVDLEELLARTYPKEVHTGEKTEGGGELRRSKRNKKKAARWFKSAEFVKKWSGEEEIRVAKALLESSFPGGGLNTTEFYQRGKEVLDYQVSSCQLYDKMRRMKRRFMLIKSMMEQGHVPEHQIDFRTPQEPALFKIWQRIWGQNNNAEKLEAGNLDIRAIGAENGDQNPNPRAPEAENPDGSLTGAENTNAGVNGAVNPNPNPGVIELENNIANPSARETQNLNSRLSAAENPRIHKSIVIEIGNSDPSVTEEIGNPSPTVRQAGNCNSLVHEALNPLSCASGAEKPKKPNPGVIEDPNTRETNVENPGPRLKENPHPNGPEAEECNGDTGADHMPGYAVRKGGITRPRPEIHHNGGFGNFQASSGFGSEIIFEECVGSCVSKKIKNLVNAANNVEYICHPESHEKFRQHYVKQLKLFKEGLELVQEECDLWLNVLEAPNGSQKP